MALSEWFTFTPKESKENSKKPDLKIVKDEEPKVLADNLMDLQTKPATGTRLKDLKPNQAEYDEAMAETRERLGGQSTEDIKFDSLHDDLYSELSQIEQGNELKPMPEKLLEAKNQFAKAGKEALYQTLVRRYERIAVDKVKIIINQIQNADRKEDKLNLLQELANTISNNLNFEAAGGLISHLSDEKPKVSLWRRIKGHTPESQQDIYNRAFDQAHISRTTTNKQSTQRQNLDAQVQSNADFMRNIK